MKIITPLGMQAIAAKLPGLNQRYIIEIAFGNEQKIPASRL